MGIGSQLRTANIIRKIVFFILSISVVAATVYLTVRFILPCVKNPASLLKYPRTKFVILSFVFWVIGAVIIALIHMALMKIVLNSGTQKVSGIKWLPVVCNGAAVLWMLYLLIISATQFSKKIGTITISNADELAYIRNYPGGEYELSGNIDMEGREWKSVSKFTGKINGRSYYITNIKVGKDGIIEENRGEISGIYLSGVKYSDFQPDADFGTLVKINKGSVKYCVLVSNLYFQSQEQSGADRHPAEGILIGYNYGEAEYNGGKVTDKYLKHDFEKVSSKESSFFKNGTQLYQCTVCKAAVEETVWAAGWIAGFIAVTCVVFYLAFLYCADSDNKGGRAFMLVVALLVTGTAGVYVFLSRVAGAPFNLSPLAANIIFAIFFAFHIVMFTCVISVWCDDGYAMAATVTFTCFLAILFGFKEIFLDEYALALAIITGVLALCELVSVCMIIDNRDSKLLAVFAGVCGVIAVCFTIYSGIKWKESTSVVKPDAPAPVESVQEAS